MNEENEVQLETEIVGPLPIVNHFIKRLGIEDILSKYITTPNKQRLDPVTCIGILLRNIIMEREPLYGLKDWTERYRPELLNIDHDQIGFLNDDRVGRALDYLYDADRATLLTEIAVKTIIEFNLNTSQLHNDSSSITFSGKYSDANGDNKRGKKSLKIIHGLNKDHRPDLKQLLWILTVTADGAVPIHYRACDGNTTDSPTHITTWNILREIVGRSDFMYVADCKLCTSNNLKYINLEGGKFITVIPRSYHEDTWFREYIQTNKVPWEDIEPPYSNIVDTPEETWKMVESPMRSSDGFRVVWTWSSRKEELDKLGRQKLMETAISKLDKLEDQLRNPRTRIRSRNTVVEKADEIVDDVVGRWIEYNIHEKTKYRFKQEKRGRPGNHTRYQRTPRKEFHVTWNYKLKNIEYDARSDGMFPLITNCEVPSLKDILDIYKYQPKLEKRHQQLKSVYDVAPIFLKSVTRIEGFLFVYFTALLVQALIEREIRLNMKKNGVASLPIYFEERESVSPTTDKVFLHFNNVEFHRLRSKGSIVRNFNTTLSCKQKELLEMAGVPMGSYTNLS